MHRDRVRLQAPKVRERAVLSGDLRLDEARNLVSKRYSPAEPTQALFFGLAGSNAVYMAL
jgi:hypothetical protein